MSGKTSQYGNTIWLIFLKCLDRTAFFTVYGWVHVWTVTDDGVTTLLYNKSVSSGILFACLRFVWGFFCLFVLLWL